MLKNKILSLFKFYFRARLGGIAVHFQPVYQEFETPALFLLPLSLTLTITNECPIYILYTPVQILIQTKSLNSNNNKI